MIYSYEVRDKFKLVVEVSVASKLDAVGTLGIDLGIVNLATDVFSVASLAMLTT